jgi:ATP-dependent DNA ligase
MEWCKRKRRLRGWPAGIPVPSIPTRQAVPPSGPAWLHEIKHDGYRLIVRRDGEAVRVYARGGHDWTERYPAIVAGALRLRARCFTIDGEGVVEGEGGISDFALLHSRQHDRRCYLIGFDLLEAGGEDIRALPLQIRKGRLAQLLRTSESGIVYSEHVDGDGAVMFQAACRMGLEGIVSKRRDRAYTSGPGKHWIKVKNPDAPWRARLEETS